MGHGIAAHELFQRALVGADQIDLVTQIVTLHGYDLPAVIGQETLQLGKLLQKLRFVHCTLSQFLEIGSGRSGVLEGAGQQQCIQLLLGCGNSNDFDYVFVISILPNGRVAPYTVVTTDGVTHDEAIQQGRNQFLFRQWNRLLLLPYHIIELQKKQQLCCCFSKTLVL